MNLKFLNDQFITAIKFIAFPLDRTPSIFDFIISHSYLLSSIDRPYFYLTIK